jgi:signal transduction histidine kinase
MDQSGGKTLDDQEFLKLAIHDLNNCLSVILASAELLELEISDQKPRRRIEVVEQKAEEARRILEELSIRTFD